MSNGKTVVSRGDDPPYPPMSGLARPMAKTAIISGTQAQTRAAGSLGSGREGHEWTF
jgi:hypothetical protein